MQTDISQRQKINQTTSIMASKRAQGIKAGRLSLGNTQHIIFKNPQAQLPTTGSLHLAAALDHRLRARRNEQPSTRAHQLKVSMDAENSPCATQSKPPSENRLAKSTKAFLYLTAASSIDSGYAGIDAPPPHEHIGQSLSAASFEQPCASPFPFLALRQHAGQSPDLAIFAARSDSSSCRCCKIRHDHSVRIFPCLHIGHQE